MNSVAGKHRASRHVQPVAQSRVGAVRGRFESLLRRRGGHLAARQLMRRIAARTARASARWLASFKEVAVMDGLSRRAVDAALDGVTYDPNGQAARGGAAMSGITSPASPQLTSRREWSRGAGPSLSATPGRSPQIEQRFGVPAPVLVAIWGQETGFGGDIGSFPTYSALATLAWDCRRATTVPRRAYRCDHPR